jgi:hypothetical protein
MPHEPCRSRRGSSLTLGANSEHPWPCGYFSILASGHSLESLAGGVGLRSCAWKRGGYYRNSGSFRVCGRRAPRQVSRAATCMTPGRFAAIGSVRLMAAACSGVECVLSPSAFVFGAEPNKAPEPTTFAVTSRALEWFPERRAWTAQSIVARAAPAKVVAHL